MIKVLHIASGDFRSTYGGGQVYVRNLALAMSQRDDVDVSVISFIDNTNDDATINEYRIDNIRVYNASAKSWRGINRALTAVKNIVEPDIIHAHSHKEMASVYGQDNNIPIVVTAHHGGILCPAGSLLNADGQICNKPEGHANCLKCVLKNTKTGVWWYPVMKHLPPKYYVNVGNWIANKKFILVVTPVLSAANEIKFKNFHFSLIAERATAIIAPSNAIADAMVLNGMSRDKIHVITHGIPLPEAQLDTTPKSKETIDFFYVGRVCEIKGAWVLIDAFKKLDNKNARLHIIGEPDVKQAAKFKHKIASDPRIINHGKVAPDKVYDVIAQLDIAVSPTICMEIFGLNIAEALAMHKPVLATRNGGAEMQIIDGKNGWLVEPNDVVALRDKMKWICENIHTFTPETSNFKVKSIEQHAAELLQLYKKYLSK